MAQCYHCKESFEAFLERGYGGAVTPRDLECPNCMRDVRCCKNCNFYSPGSRWDCHETIEDPVYDKERRNFCPSFTLKKNTINEGRNKKDSDAKAAFLNLFSETE